MRKKRSYLAPKRLDFLFSLLISTIIAILRLQLTRWNKEMRSLRKTFGYVGAPIMMGLAAVSPAFANDASESVVHPASTSQQITSAMTLDEIKDRPDLYKNKIILHYDNNIQGVDADISVLQDRGFDAMSIPAGNTGCGVRLIVSGVTGDKLCFTQSHLYKGEVGGMAMALFPKVIERQSQQAMATTVQTASLDR